MYENKLTNEYTYLLAPNPITTFNTISVYPTVHASAFIGPYSCIIGDVTIDENVFIACNVSIRADEGTPFFIGKNSNIQDGCVFHGLENSTINVHEKEYSIYISNYVTCAHRSIIHGPCYIGNRVFVGFNSMVFNATIGDGCYISANSVVTGGVWMPPNRFVPSGVIIDTQEKADALKHVTDSQENFVDEVLHCNLQYPKSYHETFSNVNLEEVSNY
ncbi:hypothetical protein [Romboutsia sp.]|uniref:hypothetical protein n=1 Tax=Romboutsia sp. TaxID=1965302 RepID=UPI003F30C547